MIIIIYHNNFYFVVVVELNDHHCATSTQSRVTYMSANMFILIIIITNLHQYFTFNHNFTNNTKKWLRTNTKNELLSPISGSLTFSITITTVIKTCNPIYAIYIYIYIMNWRRIHKRARALPHLTCCVFYFYILQSKDH